MTQDQEKELEQTVIATVNALAEMARVVNDLRSRIAAIEQTQDVQESCTTPEVVRRVPQPLTAGDMLKEVMADVLKEGVHVIARILKEKGLGIYRTSDIEEACRK